MKTTIEIPDDLFRAVKARAALENVRIKDLMAGLLRGWLEHGTAALQPGETGESAGNGGLAQRMAIDRAKDRGQIGGPPQYGGDPGCGSAMKLVIDAKVWIAAHFTSEPHSVEAGRLLVEAAAQGHELVCPVLLLAEVACTAARKCRLKVVMIGPTSTRSGSDQDVEATQRGPAGAGDAAPTGGPRVPVCCGGMPRREHAPVTTATIRFEPGNKTYTFLLLGDARAIRSRLKEERMPTGTVVDESTVRLARLDAAARRNSVGAFDGPFGNPYSRRRP